MTHKTTVEIDDELLDFARRLLGTSTIRDTIDAAFRRLRDEQREQMKATFERYVSLGLPELTNEDRFAAWTR